jgi:hypothetical protein
METAESTEKQNNDEELIAKIRARMDEVKTLIEGMKSKLPQVEPEKM